MNVADIQAPTGVSMKELGSPVDLYRDVDQLMLKDLERYCERLVKIKDRSSGRLIPFTWGTEQRFVHQKLEEQKRKTGMVRALILKPRKRGISTYIGARFYRDTSMAIGVRTSILTHEDAATQNLFEMVQTMHKEMDADFRPRATSDRMDGLEFGGLLSSYRLATAKTKGTGRSDTIRRFHGSEVAFWPESGDHDSGIMQAIPREFDTEGILESTGNGVGGMFYRMWQQAEKGLGDYITIFFPWFWAEDYRAEVPANFEPSKEEAEYAETYGLDIEQMAWMRNKNIELGGEIDEICWKFRQEYPADAVDAFQTGGVKSYISARYVVKARHREVETYDFQPLILGMDVARGGEDTCRIIDRHGRRAGGKVDMTFQTDDLTVASDHLVRTIRKLKNDQGIRVKRAYVDITGLGAGVVDHIHALHEDMREVVVGINFGSAASEDKRYGNKRAEMWARMKAWFQTKAGVQIPDKDDWQRHVCSVSEPGTVQGGTRYDAANRLVLESKENLRTRLKLSPDAGDALGLTFSEELPPEIEVEESEPEWMKRVRLAHLRTSVNPLNAR